MAALFAVLTNMQLHLTASLELFGFQLFAAVV